MAKLFPQKFQQAQIFAGRAWWPLIMAATRATTEDTIKQIIYRDVISIHSVLQLQLWAQARAFALLVRQLHFYGAYIAAIARPLKILSIKTC
jgi:hypothetical protein